MFLQSRYIFACLTVGFLMAGVWDYLRNFENNGCEMTWMFEYPKYMKVQLEDSVEEKYSKYGLYIYGEGQYARRISTLRLDGVPVLFVPGNAGSYRQVRSLASVALRKAESLKKNFEFNYFSIDFNEELVGVFGGVLQDQTEFVHECIKMILGFYKMASHPPSSVVLVGHSMGGLVARAVFTLPGFDHNLVSTIITQATPHQAPPLPMDDKLVQFYEHINSYWHDHAHDLLRDVTVVSTGGGYRDILVRNGLTSLRGIVHKERGISTCTMSVPKAWVSTDHLCAVWCRQMVLVTKRAMFDIIDPHTRQVTRDVDRRMRVFRHHFLSNPGSKQLVEKLPGEITLVDDIPWNVQSERLFTFKTEKMQMARYFAIPIIREEKEEWEAASVDSVVILSNITRENWVCYCTVKPGTDRCTSCINLSARAQALPPLYSGKKVLRMYLKELGEATHIVIISPASRNGVEIQVEQYKMLERHLIFNLPGVYDTIISYPVSVLDMAAMLQIRNESVYYSLHLAGLEGPLRAYTAHIVPRRCRKLNAADYEGIVYTLNVPWSNESTYGFAKYRENGVLPVKLQSPKPSDAGDKAVHLEMYLHPSCSYQLRLTTSPVHVIGQFIRFYGAMFPCGFVAVMILTLRGHFVKMGVGDICVQATEAVFLYGRPISILPTILLLRFLTGYPEVHKLLAGLGLPEDDKNVLESRDLWFFALPPVLFISSFLVSILLIRLLLTGAIVKTFMLSLIFRWVPESVKSVGYYVQISTCVLALIASITVCGSVGLLLSYFVLGAKVLWLCNRCRASRLKEDESKFSFHFILILVYLWLLLLNTPSLAMWVKSLSFSLRLPGDPSWLVGAVTSVITLLYVLDDSIDFNSSSCVAVGWMLYLLATMSAMYGMDSVYRLSYIIVAVLCVSAIPKLQGLVSTIISPPKHKDE